MVLYSYLLMITKYIIFISYAMKYSLRKILWQILYGKNVLPLMQDAILVQPMIIY